IAETETTTILLQGETGTGKDILARAIHQASSRAKEPFISIPCVNIPGTLLESELFGYEKGAFTDARTQKKGLLETSSGGTVYLDEIGDVDLSVQMKLLRFLEEKTFRKLGGIKEISADTRIIASTNRDLEMMVAKDTFRKDLYYRLKVFHLYLPPLRERKEDILLLTSYFVDFFKSEYRKNVRGVSKETEGLLVTYDWPGNVRELRNVNERCVMLQKKGELQPRYLPSEISGNHKTVRSGVKGLVFPEDGISLEQVEHDLCEEALNIAKGNKSKAAKLLGISRDTLRYRLKKYRIKV
ncbi:MAG: sigma-54-dependent Fis family transcriptional regulator, partial [Candidatus Cloacimonadota bacterium]